MKELSRQEFEGSFVTPMRSSAEIEIEPVIDIWPSIKGVVEEGVVDQYVYKHELVEHVYRNGANTFDHVLLPTKEQDMFIVIVVDVLNQRLHGYRSLDLLLEYGINK